MGDKSYMRLRALLLTARQNTRHSAESKIVEGMGKLIMSHSLKEERM